MYAEEELYTSWGKMKPLDAKNNNRGTHFQRIDEEFFNFLQGF